MQCPFCNAQNLNSAITCKACGAPLGAGVPTAATDVLPTGMKLQGDHYAITGVLGHGGFGITYCGEDTRLQRPVAIKEFFPFGCTRQSHQSTAVQHSGALTPSDYESAKRKFLEEGCVLARFQHPGIVNVYTCFEENNTAYMVMELLRGKTLLRLVEECGALPENEAMGYIEKVGEALEAVHQAELLHRDIKPDNVMVCQDARVVLIDFGTAKDFAAGRTQSHSVVVTPGYAPLEQYALRAQRGPYTDVYGLAATLYHLVTGQMPIPATDRAAGVELMPPHRLNPNVSETLSDAIMWAMALKVDERPQTVRDFLRALRQSRQLAPVAASSITPPEPPSTVPELHSSPPPLHLVEGFYRVWVSDPDVAWPEQCACCGESSITTLPLRKTRWDATQQVGYVPYCSACLRHVETANLARGALIATALIASFIWFVAVGTGSARWSDVSALMFYLFPLIFTTLIMWKINRAQAKALSKTNCCAIGPAVRYSLDLKAHCFHFKDRNYAEAFQQLNSAKLI